MGGSTTVDGSGSALPDVASLGLEELENIPWAQYMEEQPMPTKSPERNGTLSPRYDHDHHYQQKQHHHHPRQHQKHRSDGPIRDQPFLIHRTFPPSSKLAQYSPPFMIDVSGCPEKASIRDVFFHFGGDKMVESIQAGVHSGQFVITLKHAEYLQRFLDTIIYIYAVQVQVAHREFRPNVNAPPFCPKPQEMIIGGGAGQPYHGHHPAIQQHHAHHNQQQATSGSRTVLLDGSNVPFNVMWPQHHRLPPHMMSPPQPYAVPFRSATSADTTPPDPQHIAHHLPAVYQAHHQPHPRYQPGYHVEKPYPQPPPRQLNANAQSFQPPSSRPPSANGKPKTPAPQPTPPEKTNPRAEAFKEATQELDESKMREAQEKMEKMEKSGGGGPSRHPLKPKGPNKASHGNRKNKKKGGSGGGGGGGSASRKDN